MYSQNWIVQLYEFLFWDRAFNSFHQSSRQGPYQLKINFNKTVNLKQKSKSWSFYLLYCIKALQ